MKPGRFTPGSIGTTRRRCVRRRFLDDRSDGRVSPEVFLSRVRIRHLEILRVYMCTAELWQVLVLVLIQAVVLDFRMFSRKCSRGVFVSL